MQTRTLIAVAGAAVVVGAVAFFAGERSGTAPQQAGTGEKLFPALAQRMGDVAAVALTAEGVTSKVVKKGDAWVLASKGDFPVKPDRIRDVLVGVAELTKFEARTAKAELHDKLEVEPPEGAKAKSRLVVLETASGEKLASVVIGKTGPNAGADKPTTFVRKPDESQVWLATGRVQLPAGEIGWVDRQITHLRQERVREAVLQLEPGKTLRVFRNAWTERNLALADMPKGHKLKSESSANTVAFALEYLDFDDVAPRPTSGEVASAQVLATYRTLDGVEITAKAFTRDGKEWVALDASFVAPKEPVPAEAQADVLSEEVRLRSPDKAKAEAEALQAKLGKWIYRLPDHKMSRLRTKLDELVEPEKPAQEKGKS